jgi:hypothetical protein
MFKYTLVVMLAALFSNGTAFAQENRGTAEQRAACAPERCLQSRLRSRGGSCFGQDSRIVPLSRRER